MAAAGFLSDLKRRFDQGDMTLKFIYFNVGVFVLTSFLGIVLTLFKISTDSWGNLLALPADLIRLLHQPWGILTYMFMHAGLLHLLFNMLWLYWFGQLFLYFYSSRHLRGLYFLGGILGGACYILAYHLFPYFESAIPYSYLVGASASVLAIVVATAVREPDYRVQFMFIGAVRLKYVALFMVISDLLLMTSENAGGHIAHLGGALAGFWFAVSLRKGSDLTAWINLVIDKLTGWLSFGNRKPKKPKMKVHYGTGTRQQDYDFNARKKEQSEKVDRILEKLRRSGYDSLTADEKKSLFDASKK